MSRVTVILSNKKLSWPIKLIGCSACVISPNLQKNVYNLGIFVLKIIMIFMKYKRVQYKYFNSSESVSKYTRIT